MKTSIQKRWLALFCAMILLPWGTFLSRAEATVTSPDVLESWTIKTVGMEDVAECNSSRTYIHGTATDKLLDGKAFHGIVKFANNASDLKDKDYIRLYFGKSKSEAITLDARAEGILRLADTTWKAVHPISSESVGSALPLVGTELDLIVTTEFVNTSKDGTTTDVNVGIWINGNLYNDGYIKLEGLKVDSLVQNFHMDIGNKSTNTVKVSSPDIVTSPEDLEQWDISTVKLEDTTCNPSTGHEFRGKDTGKTLDSKVFKALVKFAGNADNIKNNEYTRVVIGKTLYDVGLILDAVADGKLKFFYNDGKKQKSVTTITPQKAGLEDGVSLVDDTINLMVTTEFFNTTETHTDIKVGLYFNGKLYDGKYIKVYNVAKDTLSQNFGGNVWGDYGTDCETLWVGMIPDPSVPEVMTPISSLTPWLLTTVGLNELEVCNATNRKFRGTQTAETLDGKAFITDIKFNDANDKLLGAEYMRIILGVDDDVDAGFILQAKENGNLEFFYHDGKGVLKGMMTISGDEFEQPLVGEYFNLAITTEFFNNTGTTTDVKVGIYIDGEPYHNQYVIVKDVELSTLVQNFAVNNWGKKTGEIWLRIPDEYNVLEPITPPEELKQWTITDVGLSASECNENVRSVAGKSTGETLDGKAFVTMITYGDDKTELKTGEALRICIGTGESQSFMLDAVDGGNLRFMHFDNNELKGITRIFAEQAGLDRLIGKQFKLTVTTEFVNISEDGTRTDVNVGLYFNDVLYLGSYIKVEDVAIETLKQNFRMFNWGLQNETIKVRNPFLTEYPAVVDEFTGADFGFKDVVVTNKTKTGTYDEKEFRSTAVTMNMVLPNKKDNSIYFGGQTYGVRLQSQGNGSIAVSYVDSKGHTRKIVTLDAKTAKVTSLTDKELEWRFTFQICETDDNKGDLQMGIYIGGQLYNSEHFEVKDVEISSLKRSITIHANEAQYVISESKYTELTFNDFSVLDADVKKDDLVSGTYQRYNFYDKALLDNTSVTGVVNMSNVEGDRFTIGGGDWQGINVCSYPDGRIWVCFVYGNGNVKSIAHLTPDKAGVDALLGKEIEMKFTFDIFHTTEGKANLKLGIYVNGKLYEGKHILVTDVETAQLTRTLFVWVKTGPFVFKSIKETEDFHVYGFDSNWKKTLGLK